MRSAIHATAVSVTDASLTTLAPGTYDQFKEPGFERVKLGFTRGHGGRVAGLASDLEQGWPSGVSTWLVVVPVHAMLLGDTPVSMET